MMIRAVVGLVGAFMAVASVQAQEKFVVADCEDGDAAALLARLQQKKPALSSASRRKQSIRYSCIITKPILGQR
jgi:hypothetical protein